MADSVITLWDKDWNFLASVDAGEPLIYTHDTVLPDGSTHRTSGKVKIVG
ncbi:hypothetical protein [Mycolicibacterium mucogenicum]|nr:hypothetical protein [Mycolicibacterium mucogenicum]